MVQPVAVRPAWSNAVVGRRTSVFVRLSLLILVLASTAVSIRLGSTQWYVFAVAALTVVILSDRPLLRQTPVSYRAIGALALFGFFGCLYGRFIEEQNANSLALFFPLLIVAADSLASRAIDVSRVLPILKTCVYAYCISALATLVLGLPIVPEHYFRHQSSFYLFLGLAIGVLGKDYILLIVSVATSIICVLNYPALTFVYVAATVLPVLLTHFVDRKTMRWLIASYVVLAAVLYTLKDYLERLGGLYYQATGKIDNTRTREILYDVGMNRLSESPYWGSFFVDDISIDSPLGITGPVLRVPLHNDYLQLAVGGGVFWVAGFVIAIVVFLASRLLSLADLPRSNDQRISMTVAVATCTAILTTAIYNPMLIASQNAIVLALLLVVIANLRDTSARVPKDTYSNRAFVSGDKPTTTERRSGWFTAVR
ncbi:O-antigen ligase family protein [Gordonia ajococcus]|uniref:O-antigen ligase family protein n=1 Tax=Gordonia ajococcus TaxID=1292359 RepID=UPI00397752ED